MTGLCTYSDGCVCSYFINFYLILVILSSSGNIFISGVNPVFNCGSASVTITSVEWLISQISGQGTLVFNNISVEYNNTNIQCRANSSNGETADSNNLTLLVQGERE